MQDLVLLVFLTTGCFTLFPADGGSEAEFEGPWKFNVANIALPPSYRIELVASGLTFPTCVAFDGEALREHG